MGELTISSDKWPAGAALEEGGSAPPRLMAADAIQSRSTLGTKKAQESP